MKHKDYYVTFILRDTPKPEMEEEHLTKKDLEGILDSALGDLEAGLKVYNLVLLDIDERGRIVDPNRK